MAVNWRLMGNLKVISADIKKIIKGATIYSVGDASHQSRTSDHNPYNWGYGVVVSAIDVMIRNGFTKTDAKNLVKALLGRSDLQYIIYNGTIWSASWGWKAKRYTGKDKHTDHVHISAKHNKSADTTKKGVVFRTPAKQPESTRPTSNPMKPVSNTKPVAKAPNFPLSENSYYSEANSPHYRDGVKRFQQKLKDRGWNIKADGFFGDKTADVVRAFQKEKKITPDAKVGPQTWNKIFTAAVTK